MIIKTSGILAVLAEFFLNFAKFEFIMIIAHVKLSRPAAKFEFAAV